MSPASGTSMSATTPVGPMIEPDVIVTPADEDDDDDDDADGRGNGGHH